MKMTRTAPECFRTYLELQSSGCPRDVELFSHLDLLEKRGPSFSPATYSTNKPCNAKESDRFRWKSWFSSCKGDLVAVGPTTSSNALETGACSSTPKCPWLSSLTQRGTEAIMQVAREKSRNLFTSMKSETKAFELWRDREEELSKSYLDGTAFRVSNVSSSIDNMINEYLQRHKRQTLDPIPYHRVKNDEGVQSCYHHPFRRQADDWEALPTAANSYEDPQELGEDLFQESKSMTSETGSKLTPLPAPAEFETFIQAKAKTDLLAARIKTEVRAAGGETVESSRL
ncbi:hypothetical protein cyc_04513 [Cyclospora cayetanensis]|uniref:Uncharacterized protein n=1 Tax=Cyclospora cayetanensis TaxID=88456 RepID=A0A1D3D2S4_9EIME|nr:hypothetical protein cyc_04513 [Cyclospora cayetanensis]